MTRVPSAWLLCALSLFAGGRATGQSTTPPAGKTLKPTPKPSLPIAPLSTTGSLGPGVYYQDITYTMRAVYFRTLTVSPHDPNVAYVGSYDGYVWKTTDGGQTWTESRLIQETKPHHGDAEENLYFGTHRDGAEAWEELHLDSEGEEAERPLLGSSSLARTRPSAVGGHEETYPGARMLLSRSRFESIAEGGGRGRSLANVNFGIGLPGGAPRLQVLVRKFGKPTSGVNIKQTLLLRGSRPTDVNNVVVHPRNPRIVFACTSFGLFRTNDGGITWVRTFTGVNPAGRQVFHLAVDPKDDRKVLLGTGNGVYVSADGGDNFFPHTSQGVGGEVITWIYVNPYDSKYIFVATESGLLRSSDGGENWDWIYFTTLPAARIVRNVVIDPHDRKTGYIATHDGVFSTPDLLKGNLESWRRVGGLRLTGMEVPRVTVCNKHRGHLWTLTNARTASVTDAGLVEAGGAFVWESIDAGKTWKVIYAGETAGSMDWFDNHPSDPDLLWIAWSRSLTRMKRRLPGERVPRIDAHAEQRLRALLKGESYPSVSDVMMAAVMWTGVDPGRMLKYRQRSRLKALVPRLDLSYTHYQFKDYPLLRDGLYASLPFMARETLSAKISDFRFVVSWNLGDLVFNLDQSLFGRVDRVNKEIRDYLKHAIHRYYGELRRLQALMIVRPPQELAVRMAYKSRIEELESYVDLITGGYLTRYKTKGRISGLRAPWLGRWSNN